MSRFIVIIIALVSILSLYSMATFEDKAIGTEGKPEVTGSQDLIIGKFSFLKFDMTGPPSEIEDGTIGLKDQIILVLENVGTFKEANGKHWYDIDFSIETPEGKSLFAKEGYLGETGKDSLPQGVLERYNITVNPGVMGIKPGEYIFRATIYDKIGGKMASVSKEFTIQQNDALKSKSTPPATVDMEATDNKSINGTISVKGQSISIRHAYPYLAPNAFASMYPEKYKEKMDLQVLFSDNEVPKKAFPRDKDGNSELLDLMRAEKVHALLIIFDRETKQMTTLAEEGAVYINDVSPDRLGMQGYYMVEYLKYGDKMIEGKVSMYEDVIDIAGWDFNVKFKINLPPEVR